MSRKLRRKLKLGVAFLGFIAASGIAGATDLRELCPTRPGLGTAPCIVDQGHLLVEIGFGDWTVDNSSDARSDTILFGDALLRLGLSSLDEIQFGWTPYGHVRERDKPSGAVRRRNGIGDMALAYKRSLAGPDGKGLSLAIQPFVTLPVGSSAISDGTWSAGLVLPVSFDVSEHLQLQATPEIDAHADEDGHGRHGSFGSVFGVGLATSDNTGLTFELSAFRENEPSQHFTELLGGVSGTWQPDQKWQLDAGAVFGLNRDSPDLELTAGVSRRF